MSDNLKPILASQYDDEIDLREIFRAIWFGKWLIAGISTVTTVIAVIVALSLPNIYRAEALLAPNEQESGAGLSALAAQYGGLAALAGINIGPGSSNKAELGLMVLKSRQFISDFIERRDILVPLIAADGWNAETGELNIDPDIYDVIEKKWVRRETSTRKAVPSRQEAQEEFLRILSIIEDRNSGFVTVAIEHLSPHVAHKWLDWLVEDLNSTMMRQDVTQAKQAIEYLNNEIERTSLADLQRVFFNLIEEQTKIVMLARVSPEYVFRTIDPAVVPEKRSKPNRALIAIAGLLLGGLIGTILVLLTKSTLPRKDES